MKKLINKILILCLLVGQFSWITACGTSLSEAFSKSGYYFNTIISLTLYEDNSEELIDQCFSLAKKYEDMLSNTIDTSDVSMINAAAGEDYVSVNPETLELIETGIKYCKLGDGRFDITIGNLTDLWDFSDISANAADNDNEVDESVLPDQSAIEALLPHIDYKNIQIQDDKVMLTDPEAKLDLGGIAKGYIADKMKAYLTKQGVKKGIINLGGNVLVIGTNAKDQDYTVGIQKPFDDAGTALITVSVTDKSVVTSGVYERYYRINGKLYHHILDPDTGYPVENNLYSVTIISDNSVDGDALSTLCFVLGMDKGMELIDSLEGVEAVFVDSDMGVHYSDGFN